MAKKRFIELYQAMPIDPIEFEAALRLVSKAHAGEIRTRAMGLTIVKDDGQPTTIEILDPTARAIHDKYPDDVDKGMSIIIRIWALTNLLGRPELTQWRKTHSDETTTNIPDYVIETIAQSPLNDQGVLSPDDTLYLIKRMTTEV